MDDKEHKKLVKKFHEGTLSMEEEDRLQEIIRENTKKMEEGKEERLKAFYKRLPKKGASLKQIERFCKKEGLNCYQIVPYNILAKAYHLGKKLTKFDKHYCLYVLGGLFDPAKAPAKYDEGYMTFLLETGRKALKEEIEELKK